MDALLLAPAALSLLALAAHFLRAGDWPALGACLALAVLLFVRRRWAARVVQLGLIAGAGVWVATAFDIGRERDAAGAPWLRMAVILGAVALVALLSALAFETRRLKAWFSSSPEQKPDAQAAP